LVAVVGPSGCGKTTTLRLIAGLEEPTEGDVCIAGRVVNRVPIRERDVAMVFQRPALYPHLRVRDNLAFGAALRSSWWGGGRRALGKRVAETAAALGLSGLLDRYPGQLSGGQQQRVALGRALVRQPALFLLDEPLSNLDAGLRAEMRRELHLLQRRLRATMIYVTHDPAEALALGDRVVVLDQGTVQDVGTPDALYDRPANRFVAGFLPWPPMNLVDGTLAQEGTDWRFLAGGEQLPVPPSRVPVLERSPGNVTLGIRPQDVALGRRGGCDTRLAMRVALVEPVGGERLVTLERAGWRLTARDESRETLREGQTVDLMLNMERSYWFDGQTGRALALGAGLRTPPMGDSG
jgi:multiple sugar transport system ATP-binding protein